MIRKTKYDIWRENLRQSNPLLCKYIEEKERIIEEALQEEANRKLIPIMQTSLAAALKEEFTRQLKDQEKLWKRKYSQPKETIETDSHRIGGNFFELVLLQDFKKNSPYSLFTEPERRYNGTD